MQNTINKPPLDKPSTKATPLVESDEDEDRFVITLENRSDGPLTLNLDLQECSIPRRIMTDGQTSAP
jgi:hypothetical protein